MSVRNLGDWSPLGLDKDPIDADVDRIGETQRRYHKIAVTIDDAINKLGKIVDTGSESLAGQYVEALKGEATSIRDDLTKVKVRYDDVASEITKYRPHLDSALEETKKALQEARDAEAAKNKAEGMADPQAAEDGSIPPEENDKRELKDKAIGAANADLSKAKNKLDSAMNDLNTAGKAFGDAVNCNKYDDGLTDTAWDGFLDFLENIGSKILSVLGIVLAALTLAMPGLNLVLLAALGVAALTLAVDIVLYKNDRGSLADVILSSVGLLLIGGTAVASTWAKHLASNAKYAAIELRSWAEIEAERHIATRNFPKWFWDAIPKGNAATEWKNLSDWFHNPLTNRFLKSIRPDFAPTVGFFESMGEQWKSIQAMWKAAVSGNFLSSAKEMLRAMSGLNGIRELAQVRALAGEASSMWWSVWAAANAAYTFLHGILYSSMRYADKIPPANPS